MGLTDLQIITLVERYRRERDRFEKLAGIVSRRISARLSAAAIPHVPTFRSKDPASLRNKLARDSARHSFARFERDFSPSVKDLAGVRVLLYRPRDLEPTCAIVEDLFSVPRPEDFRRDYATAEGYRARHRVVALRVEDIDADPACENIRFTPCEIQIATVSDHIWNELQHDIVYKTPHGIPTDVQTTLLTQLRGQLNLVGGTVDQLMEATDRQRAAAAATIESPEDLRNALEVRTGRRLVGDFETVLKLLSAIFREPTRTLLHHLPLSSADLDAAQSLMDRAEQPTSSDDLALVLAALWPRYGVDFVEVVRPWRGRPGPLSRLVRALDKATVEGKI